jgi:hypothetical protein
LNNLAFPRHLLKGSSRLSAITRLRPPQLSILLLFWLCASTPLSATISISPWTPLFKGVDFATGTADASEPRRQQVVALRIDLADPTIQFFSTPGNGAASLETFGQTTTTFVQTYAAAVGINANFFSPVSTTPNEPRDLSGLAVSQGTVVSPFENGRPAILISRSNQASFAASSPANLSNVWTAVAGSDLVVLQGANKVSTNCTTAFCGPNPRSAVGVSQDNHYLYMIVIDGRQPGWSDGATLVETGDWLLRFGAWNGLNLDGGGSSAMARLQGGSAVLLNRPSGGVQRVNGNHLGVFAQSLAPLIVTQPQSQSVNGGANATFTVTASGGTPLYYQWRFNATALPAATGSSYTRTNVQPNHVGSYSVIVSNSSGTVISSNASLTLNQAPLITGQPPHQTVLPGQPATFSVVASGTAPLHYTWRRDGIAIPGATASSLAIASADQNQIGGYSVVVTNVAGSANSFTGRLAVVDIGAWGDNAFGQTIIPPHCTNIIAVSAGAWHNLGLFLDGRVVAWGNNWDSQCNVPLTNAHAIAAGGYHSLAIQPDGSLSGWGADDYGQSSIPANVQDVVGIAAGTWHSLALSANGQLTAWGDNSFGQTNLPAALAQVIAIAAGGNHNLALQSSGTVVAWGENSNAVGLFAGQCDVPPGLSNIIAVAAGTYHSLALKSDGTVVAWGDNSGGQCAVPPELADVRAISAGGVHSLALRADGTVVAWGANWNNQCSLPPTLTNIAAAAAGEQHTLVLLPGSLPRPLLLRPAYDGSHFRVLMQTLNSRTYALDAMDLPHGTNWMALPSILGNGALRILSDPSPGSAGRVYRGRSAPSP